MKLVSYIHNGNEQCGILLDQYIYPTSGMAMPGTMSGLLNQWEELYPRLMVVHEEIKAGKSWGRIGLDNVRLLAPVPHPTSCRDGYAFRQHVAAARLPRRRVHHQDALAVDPQLLPVGSLGEPAEQ